MNKRVLRIHLEHGTATGLQTAEIDGWIGKIIVAPKPDLPELLKRPELQNGTLGVYVLVGTDPNNGSSIIYVGQGDVAARLAQHSTKSDKDYWDSKTLVIVAAKGSGFPNSVHCRYLESRLIELARSDSSLVVENRVVPNSPFMSATDETEVENFLTQVLTILPVLKIDYFDQSPVGSSSSNTNTVQPGTSNILPPVVPVTPVSFPHFVFVTVTGTAEMEIIDSQFVVFKDTLANPNENPSIGPSNRQLRSKLRDNGSLADDPASGKWIFTKNVPFDSLSAAAGVISGASNAGPTVWKVKGTAQTYAAWEKSQVNAVVPPTTGPAPTAGITP